MVFLQNVSRISALLTTSTAMTLIGTSSPHTWVIVGDSSCLPVSTLATLKVVLTTASGGSFQSAVSFCPSVQKAARAPILVQEKLKGPAMTSKALTVTLLHYFSSFIPYQAHSLSFSSGTSSLLLEPTWQFPPQSLCPTAALCLEQSAFGYLPSKLCPCFESLPWCHERPALATPSQHLHFSLALLCFFSVVLKTIGMLSNLLIYFIRFFSFLPPV